MDKYQSLMSRHPKIDALDTDHDRSSHLPGLDRPSAVSLPAGAYERVGGEAEQTAHTMVRRWIGWIGWIGWGVDSKMTR